MVSKFAIVVNNYGQNQLAYDTISSTNEFLKKNNKTDITLFYETPAPLRQNPITAMMNIYEAWGYDGDIVMTSISSAFKVLGMPGSNKRYFYAFNPEWIHNATVFEAYYKVMSSDIEVITRTKEHSKIFENNFNKKPIFTLEQMNVEELWKSLNSYQS
jgi:hypothetical protein